MKKTETKTLKIGKTIPRNRIFSLPNVASMVFVNVIIETLAEIKLISVTQI